jgi:DNA-binding NarL/FixJ family response regulator
MATTVVVAPGTLRGLVPGIEVVGMATTAEEAVLAVRGHRPTVLLVAPAIGGVLGLVRRVRGTAVLVRTADEDLVLAALRAGARGCVPPDAEPADVVRAVHGVAAGELVFGAGVAGRLGALVGSVVGDRLGTPDRAAALLRVRAASLSRASN